MTPWHMGALHPLEQWLTLLLAFGPFVVLGIVVVVRRRIDAAEVEAEADAGPERTDTAHTDTGHSANQA